MGLVYISSYQAYFYTFNLDMLATIVPGPDSSSDISGTVVAVVVSITAVKIVSRQKLAT